MVALVAVENKSGWKFLLISRFLILIFLILAVATARTDWQIKNILVGLFSLGLLVAFFNMLLFKCPRCGSIYHFNHEFKNLFTKKCMTCGLPVKWGLKQEDLNSDREYIKKGL